MAKTPPVTPDAVVVDAAPAAVATDAAPIAEVVVAAPADVQPVGMPVRRYSALQFDTKEDFAAFIAKLQIMQPEMYERNAEELAHQLDTFYL